MYQYIFKDTFALHTINEYLLKLDFSPIFFNKYLYCTILYSKCTIVKLAQEEYNHRNKKVLGFGFGIRLELYRIPISIFAIQKGNPIFSRIRLLYVFGI